MDNSMLIIYMIIFLVALGFAMLKKKKGIKSDDAFIDSQPQGNRNLRNADGEEILIRSNNKYGKVLERIALGGMLFFMVILASVGMALDNYLGLTIMGVVLGIFLIVWLPFCIFAVAVSKTRLIVSNKRVYGETSFRKRVDLPLDSISAVGVGSFKGIAISTSSGRINFKAIGNRDEIYTVISQLLVDRQEQKNRPYTQEIPQSNADELKKYKDLLDSGVISQAEFDAKKKQLLGL